MNAIRSERGFTMPMVLGVLLVATILATSALAAARGGTAVSGESRDDKQAYAAAEAGVNWYLSRLIFDNAFWAKCATTRGPEAPVNDPWDGTGADPRLWRGIDDTTADYTIELLPANGKLKCDPTDANGTMIQSGYGTFRIRSTGRFNGNKRSIVATFRRARFLDFLYLTIFETSDPDTYFGTTAQTAAARDCVKYRGGRPNTCSEIQFAPGDQINGPLHSNDSLLICGAARFGRPGRDDRIETLQAAPGYVVPSGCTDGPNFVSALKTSAGEVQMPTGVKQLADNALPAFKLTGTTYLTFSCTKIYIETLTASGTKQLVNASADLPANGLIYVGPGPSSCTLIPPGGVMYSGAGSEAYGCANVYVSGTYSKDITIASTKDVIVNGNFTQTAGTGAVAGLIADRFVRVFHPVAGVGSDGNCTGANQAGALTNPVIEAAILAREHSFTVDNFRCGADLGTLTVTGGIAQRFRGPVGTGGNGSSTVSTGYLKNYTYDDRLTYRNPPFFLDPENATWRVLRSNEQVPAR